MQMATTSNKLEVTFLIAPVQEQYSKAGLVKSSPQLQLQCFLQMLILSCGPPVTVLSPPKRYHMGYHKVMEEVTKQRRKQPESRTLKILRTATILLLLNIIFTD